MNTKTLTSITLSAALLGGCATTQMDTRFSGWPEMPTSSPSNETAQVCFRVTNISRVIYQEKLKGATKAQAQKIVVDAAISTGDIKSTASKMTGGMSYRAIDLMYDSNATPAVVYQTCMQENWPLLAFIVVTNN